MSQTSAAMPTSARLVMLDHLVTHQEWATDWSQREHCYELVDGMPLMTPTEHADNGDATSMLLLRLAQELGEEWSYPQHTGVAIRTAPSLTYRVPDLTVLHRDAPRPYPLDPTHVVLVAEVLSPSTREEDLGRKRRDYASVLIPTYVVVDREGAPRLRAWSDPVDGDYRREQTGETVTLRVADRLITLRADGIIR